MATENKTFPLAFIRKKFVPIAKAVVPIQAKVVQYGLGVFTGIRGHYNPAKKNIYLFRLEDHFERLTDAAKIVGMKFGYNFAQFKKLILDLIKKNKAREDVYLRPTLYSGSTKLTPRFDDNEFDDLAIYMISLKDYFDSDVGLDVCVSSWRRFDDDMISTKAKVTGSYANSSIAKTEAIKNGFNEPIFLNRDGKVCEASGANLFGVKNGVVYTPPLSANNLNGVTRRSVIEVMRGELGLEVREEEFDRSTLYCFDELFFTGTAAKVTFIRSVDRRMIGDGKLGKITKKLQDLFVQISSYELEIEKYQKWCTPVY